MAEIDVTQFLTSIRGLDRDPVDCDLTLSPGKHFGVLDITGCPISQLTILGDDRLFISKRIYENVSISGWGTISNFQQKISDGTEKTEYTGAKMDFAERASSFESDSKIRSEYDDRIQDVSNRISFVCTIEKELVRDRMRIGDRVKLYGGRGSSHQSVVRTLTRVAQNVSSLSLKTPDPQGISSLTRTPDPQGISSEDHIETKITYDLMFSGPFFPVSHMMVLPNVSITPFEIYAHPNQHVILKGFVFYHNENHYQKENHPLYIADEKKTSDGNILGDEPLSRKDAIDMGVLIQILR